jgi:hypothetical protein
MASWGDECLEQPPQTQFADAVVRQAPLVLEAKEETEKAKKEAEELRKRNRDLEAQLALLRAENGALQKRVQIAEDATKHLKAELSHKTPDKRSLSEREEELAVSERMLQALLIQQSMWRKSV